MQLVTNRRYSAAAGPRFHFLTVLLLFGALPGALPKAQAAPPEQGPLSRGEAPGIGLVAGASRLPPDLTEAPRRTHTRKGLAGDPINVALVGTEKQLVKALLQAGWLPADPVTLKSSLRIATSTAFHRPYSHAPVSDLYLGKHKQDLAFEQPVGKDARRRHHVRFWKLEKEDDKGRPLWVGSATYDCRVEISHTTHLPTHKIAANIDRERDKLCEDLQKAGVLEILSWVEHFQTTLEGHNGGGDPYHTDGRLAVGILAAARE